MKILITGNSGHLEEAFIMMFTSISHEVEGIDVIPSHIRKSWDLLSTGNSKEAMKGVEAVLHTAPFINHTFKVMVIKILSMLILLEH